MFFRLQAKNISLEEMQNHKSIHGVDDDGEAIYLDALAASDNAYETGFGGSCESEVVVFEGNLIERIYDGVVVFPTKMIARFPFEEWCKMVDDGETEQYDN